MGIWELKQRIYLVTFFLAVLSASCIFFFEQRSKFPQEINLKGRDLYFQIRHVFVQPPSESNEILLVTIDDETLKRLEKTWPFPRSIYVQALNRLKPFSPKAIGFDLIFPGKDLVPTNDIQFSSALKEAGNVVIASHQSSAGEIGRQSLIGSNAWQVGIVDKPRDSDQVIRRAAFYFSVAGTIFPSWEAAIFNKAFGKSLSLGLSQNFVIDYRLKLEDFSTVPFWRVLEGSILASELQNKIILVGPTAEVFHDVHLTPLGRMPGIAINANMLTMLTRGYLFSIPPKEFMFLFNFFSIWFILLLGLTRSLRKGFWLTGLIVGSFLSVGYGAFLSYKLVDLWFLATSLFAIFSGAHLFRSGRIWFLNHQLKKESNPDPLTGFYTEKYLHLKLETEWNKLRDKKLKYLTLLIIQIDQFKVSSQQNRLVSAASQILRLSVRKSEVVCCFQDGLFVIVTDNNQEDATRFREKIKRNVEAQPADPELGKISFTVAIVSAQNENQGPKDLLKEGKRLLS